MRHDAASRTALGESRTATLAWVVLAGLLAALTVAAATFDRSSWPSWMGDEATYLMQAASLAFDGDLSYAAEDYHRFVETWNRPPQGLILQSGDDGRTIVYGKPFFYALYLAPFVRLAPTTGPFVANALLLAFAAIVAARSLRRRAGPLAPLWVAALVFGSVTFGHVFWGHPDLFLMCLGAVALSLVHDVGSDDSRSRFAGRLGPWVGARWALAGGLVTLVSYSRPLYASAFLPLLAIASWRSQRRVRIFLVVGILGIAGSVAGIQQTLSGSWTSYGAERMGFYHHTGFPGVDFPLSSWPEKIGELGNVAAVEPTRIDWTRRLDASLWGWNSVYFLVGRHVGALPYFLPVILAFAGRGWDRRRWALLAAVIVGCGAFLMLRPFNFYGGGGSLGNRYFLPLYPVLWFLVARPIRWPGLVAVSVLSALFVGQLQLAPRAFPIDREERTYRYVTPVAEVVLPYETTLSHLKLAGRDDLYPGFFLRIRSASIRAQKDGRLRLEPGADGELLLGAGGPLEAVDVLVDLPGEVRLVAEDRPVRRLDSDGPRQRFRLELSGPRARHPAWWSWDPVWFYEVRFRIEGAAEREALLSLEPVAAPG